jgi:transposase
VVTTSRRHRMPPWVHDRIRYRERNIVERFINKIKRYRRIFVRYEKLARRYMAFLHLAATLI